MVEIPEFDSLDGLFEERWIHAVLMTDIIFVLFIVGASVCVLLMAAICIYAVIEIGRQEDLIEKENPGYFND